MSELHKHQINLSAGQKHKLRIAYKRRRGVVIGLKHAQLSNVKNGSELMLTDRQHKALVKANKNKTGVRLILSYDQLLHNKEGGFLKEMMDIVETSVPGGKRFISPLVRNSIAPLLKNNFLPWLKTLIDNELDTIISKDPHGAGLKRCINNKLDTLLKKSK